MQSASLVRQPEGGTPADYAQIACLISAGTTSLLTIATTQVW